MNGERGQVGIETFVIFIAMILIAAIAAVILVNTSGLLQNAATDTALDSGTQVSDRVQVVGATGNVTANHSAVDTVTLWLTLAPSGTLTNVSKATVHLRSDGFTGWADATTGPGCDGLTTGSNCFLTVDARFEPGEEVTITIATAEGATTPFIFEVPHVLVGEETVRLG